MNSSTARSVQPRLEPARFLVVRRCAAYLFDIALSFAVLFPLGFLVQRVLGLHPRTGPEVALAILWNFSLPVWLYFTLSDASARGATLGKRLFRLRVTDVKGKRLSLPRALGRTAVKLLPWELVHLSAFTLSTTFAQLSALQLAGLAVANLLVFVYLITAIVTKGRRSVHDFLAGTMVRSTAR